MGGSGDEQEPENPELEGMSQWYILQGVWVLLLGWDLKPGCTICKFRFAVDIMLN